MSRSRKQMVGNATRRITPSLSGKVQQQAKDRFAALFNGNLWAKALADASYENMFPERVVRGRQRRVFRIRRAQ